MLDIKLERVVNARDFGGTVGAEGRKIRSGYLIRCAEMCYMTERDRQLFAERNVRRVIDLRNPSESDATPDLVVPGAEMCRMPMFPGRAVPVGGNTKQTRKEHRESIGNLVDYYRLFVTQDYTARALREVCLMLMEDIGGPQVFHCAAGKDRTGIVAACLLHMLGVPKDVIMADYCYSNRFLGPMARKYWRKEFFTYWDFRAAAAEKAVWLIDKNAMKTFWDTAESNYGSMDGFLQHRLGITPEARADFRDRLLEPAGK